MPQMFLTRDEVAVLTGRKTRTTQVRQLRTMVLPFWLDADGWPIIARVAIEGKQPRAEPPKKKWVPPGMRGNDG